MSGRLYVVGVGPGAPDLLTVKAARILQQVPVIFAPQKDEKSASYAHRTIAGMVNESEQQVIGLIFPMVRDENQLLLHQQMAADRIWQRLSRGEDCAFVNVGDPYLYGTAIHVLKILQEAHTEVEIEVVPGISSINAAAARAGVPLAINDERIAIISGHCEDAFIRETLETFDTVVFLKVNSVLDWLLGILEEKKLVENSVYVDRCTTEDEVIVRNIRTLKGRKLDYLSLLIVRK